MFATILETILVKHLGKYLDGIKKNMDISIINGDVTIQNLSIKPQFINDLGLPFVLRFSHIHKILINVPWASLKEKPTTVSVQGVYALLALKYDDDDMGFYKDSRQRIKEIVNRVKLQIKKKWQEKNSGKPQTFAQKSLIRIIDNLVLNIDEIHIRVQSIKRNWDFSIGAIIDRVSSTTVNQFGQRSFYVRHFSKKEENQTLRKQLIFGRFQIYFNDEQDFFISWQIQRGKQSVLKLMAEPFGSKSLVLASLSSSKKYKSSSQSQIVLEPPKQYTSKIMTEFSFQINLQQKLSSEGKYLIQVQTQLPKIQLRFSDKQLSQILVVLQLFYEWKLDILKNGRRNFNFNQTIEEYFKGMILKLAKDQKLNQVEWRDLDKIAMENPISKLEDSADEVIKQYRISKQMKKISKISNKEKSQQMVSKLFDKINQEDLQTLHMFEHILINISFPQFKIACFQQQKEVLNFGVISIISQVKLVLGKYLLFDLNASQIFIRDYNPKPRNLVNLSKSDKYNRQPFIQVALSQAKTMPPIIKVNLKKRYIQIYQQTLQNLLKWVILAKLKPPLLNFLSQQLNYSVYITQQIFHMLFSHSEASINIHLQIPALSIQLDNNSIKDSSQKMIKTKNMMNLELDLGAFNVSRQNSDEYMIYFEQPQILCLNNKQILKIKEGTRITLLNINPQTVDIQVRQISLKNHTQLIECVTNFLQNNLIKMVFSMKCILEEQIVFQGKFKLNQFKKPQTMVLKGNHLVFYPSGARISLLKTKMYRYCKNGQFGLIFREQVIKLINIVMVHSDKLAQKIMDTLFIRLKQHILYICTYSQWSQYYKNFNQQLIYDIHEIEYRQQNKKLIDLAFSVVQCDILFDDPYKLQSEQEYESNTRVNLNKFKGLIGYRQYNTDAEGELGSLNFSLRNYKIISNLSVKVAYSYVNFISFMFEVMSLKFNIQQYSLIDDFIAYVSFYILKINPLVAEAKKLASLKEDLIVLEQGKIQDENQRIIKTKNQLQYLLQARIQMSIKNLQSKIIGYKTYLDRLGLQILKYRNMKHPNIILEVQRILVLSILRIRKLQLSLADKQLAIDITQFFVSISFELLVYQMTAGKGNRLLNSLSNLLKTHWLAKKQQKQIKKIKKQVLEGVKKKRKMELNEPSSADLGSYQQIADESIKKELQQFSLDQQTEKIKVKINLKQTFIQLKLIQGEETALQLKQTTVYLDPNSKHAQNKSTIKNSVQIKWDGLAFLINDCLLMQPVSGLVNIRVNHTLQGQIQSKILLNLQQIIINCPLYRITQSVFVVLKISDKFINLPILANMNLLKEQSQVYEHEKKKIVLAPIFQLCFQGFMVKLLSQNSRPLLRIKSSQINFSTQTLISKNSSLSKVFTDINSESQNVFNKVQINIEYMNNKFWIYEPVLENFRIQFVISEVKNDKGLHEHSQQQSHQNIVMVNIPQIRASLSFELIENLLRQILTIQKSIDNILLHHAQKLIRIKKMSSGNNNQLKQVQVYTQAQQNQLQKYKSIMDTVLMSDEELYQTYYNHFQQKNKQLIQNKKQAKKQHKKYNKLEVSSSHVTLNTLIIQNCLHSDILTEIKIQKNKSQFFLASPHKQSDKPSKAKVKFKIKSEYRQSYQIIQKYRKVVVKVTLINSTYSAHSFFYSIMLHNQGYCYHPVKITDQMGYQVKSAIGLIVKSLGTEQYDDMNEDNTKYLIQITSPYKISNETNMQITIRNRIKSNYMLYKNIIRPMKQKRNNTLFLEPWITKQVILYADQNQHNYVSSYHLKLEKTAENLEPQVYQINLNQHLNQRIYTYTSICIIPKLLPLVSERTIAHPYYKNDSNNQMKIEEENVNLGITPIEFILQPTFFVLSHLHIHIKVNEEVCPPGQRVAITKMYRAEGKDYLKVRLGDGSMHEIYLPNKKQFRNVELKLKGDNFIKLSIYTQCLNSGKQQETYKNSQIVYHVFTHLQLLLRFPRSQQPQLLTNIYGNTFILKKQLQVTQNYEDQLPYQLGHPKKQIHHQHNTTDIQKQEKIKQLGCSDRFALTSSYYLLGDLEKYLTISTSSQKSQQIVLYPSYFGNEVNFYKKQYKNQNKKRIKPNNMCLTCGISSCNCNQSNIESEAYSQSDYQSVLSNPSKKPHQNQQSSHQQFKISDYFKTKQELQLHNKPVSIYSISYGVTKISQQISTFNVTLTPKYYIINLAMGTHFMIQGSGYLRYKDRMVLQSNLSIQITLLLAQNQIQENQMSWKILDRKEQVDIKDNKQLIYFRKLGFDDHQAFQAIKRHKTRTQLCRKRKLSAQMQIDTQKIKQYEMAFNTQNMSMYQIISQPGPLNTVNYFIKEWPSWIKIFNDLEHKIKIVSRQKYFHNVQQKDKTLVQSKQQNQQQDNSNLLNSICYFTYVDPKTLNIHPYGLQNYHILSVYAILQRGHQNQQILIGQYDTSLRLNDIVEIEILQNQKQTDLNIIPNSETQQNASMNSEFNIVTISMSQIHVDQGRKIIFSNTTNQSSNYSMSNSFMKADSQSESQDSFIRVKRKNTVFNNSMHLLKVNSSITLKIGSINISYFGSTHEINKKSIVSPYRHQLLKLNLNLVQVLILKYPSSLYMLNISTDTFMIHGTNFSKTPLLYIPGTQLYVEGVSGKFKERLSFRIKQKSKIPKNSSEKSNRIKIFLTDKMLFTILQQVSQIAKILENHKKYLLKTSENKIVQAKSTAELSNTTDYVSTINSLSISPVSLEVTVRKLIVSEEQLQSQQSKKILQKIGLSIMELDQSLIELSSVQIAQPVTNKHIKEVSKMYIIQLIVGCLGGLNLIGNPKKFIEQIEAGKVKGGVFGFLRGVLAGTTNSLSLILSTVGNGFSSLSMDDCYQRQRNELYMNQPQGLISGLKLGAKGLLFGFKSGIVGVIERPVEAVKQEGGQAVFRGSLQGLAGLIIKPVTGIIDAASITIHGIKSSSSYMSKQQLENYLLSLERPTYHKFRIIRPYDFTDELVFNCFQRIIKQKTADEINKNIFSNNQLIEAFQLEDDDGVKNQQAIIITCEHLYLLNLDTDEIILQIRNQWISGTGKFLQGVVLYFDDGRGDQDEIVFRMQTSQNAIKKERLYWTLKAFINLYKDSDDQIAKQIID